jgi:ribitol 2-dehydrogenase
MAHSLSGKVAIVTGASSGIGRATATALVRCGVRVVLAARSGEKLTALAAELGPLALAVPTDVTRAADVSRLVERTLDRFGQIDILFANAGLYVPGQVVEGDPEAWAQMIDVNLNGVLRCVHAVLPHMIARGEGDILVTMRAIQVERPGVWRRWASALTQPTASTQRGGVRIECRTVSQSTDPDAPEDSARQRGLT